MFWRTPTLKSKRKFTSSTPPLQPFGHQVILATLKECVASTFGQCHPGEKLLLDMIVSLLTHIQTSMAHGVLKSLVLSYSFPSNMATRCTPVHLSNGSRL